MFKDAQARKMYKLRNPMFNYTQAHKINKI